MGGVPAGGVEHRVDGSGIVERRVWGFLTLARSARADAELEELAARSTTPLRLVTDTLELTGLEPGAAGKGVRTAVRLRHRIACVAIVARQPLLVALSRALAVLIPDVPLRICADRAEAFAFAARTPASPPPRATR